MKNASLRIKLISSFLMVSLLTLVVGGVAVFTSERAAERYEHISEVNLPSNSSLSQMRGLAREALGLMLHLNLEGNPPEELKRVEAKLAKVYDAYAVVDATLEKVKLDAEGEKQYAEVAASWKVLEKFIKDNTKLAQASDSVSRNQLRVNYGGEFLKARLDYFAKVDKMMDYQVSDSKRWVQEAQSYTKLALNIMIGFVVLAFFVAMAFGYFFSQALSRKLMAVADSISQGSTEVARASGIVSNSSESLSSGVTEQAAALQQTSASIEELTAMVKRSSENANKSSEFATESHETASEGQRVVTEMISAMEEINESNKDITQAIERSNVSISEIATVIAAIGEKTKVINEIVFQTRLLSFNASVEAARAGEHGKGFAVVAEEVGNLAQMSGNAAQEIAVMLADSTQKVASIVEVTKREVEKLSSVSTQKVTHGKSIASRCGEVLDKVVSDASSVNRLNSDIASASREQSLGIAEITKAMHQLDESTQANSHSSQETASAAVQLTAQAEALRSSVTELIGVVTGSKTESAPAPIVKIESKPATRPNRSAAA